MSGWQQSLATALLILADGTRIEGRGIGAVGHAVGEVCFNTAMTGYQEILTDPSYAGQIITFTFPHIGNVGANDEDIETVNMAALSGVRGVVLRADITNPANYRAVERLDSWLKKRNIIGIAGVDTRALTARIRETGMPNGVIAHEPGGEFDEASILAELNAFPGLEGLDLAREVTTAQTYGWEQTPWVWNQGYGTLADPQFHIVAVDYGAKRNILRQLADQGARVTVVPATATARDILAHNPDGIFLSNGPRDMAFNQAHTLLYVACGDDDVIDIIDMAKLEVVDSIPTGRSPEMFRLSLDDKLIYVSNEESSTVEVIDIEQKVVVMDIATGAEPEGIQLSPDGSVVYATSEVADMVHFIDPVEGVVTDNVIVGTRPRRFILPNPNELWVTDELSGTVSVIDTQTATVTNTLEFLPPGFRQVDVTPVGITMTHDGATAIVTLGRANHIAFVNIATKEIEDYVLVGSRAWGVEIDKADKTVYVANGLSDDLSIIDYATRKNIRTFPVGRIPHTVVIDD